LGTFNSRKAAKAQREKEKKKKRKKRKRGTSLHLCFLFSSLRLGGFA
jgi:hypothetical protein